MAGWNLALRFLLEMSALAAIGAAAWQAGKGNAQWAAVAGAPLMAAALWGTFNVRGDPSRSGEAPVEVSGPVRLTLEALVFGAGAAGLFVVGGLWLTAAFVSLLVLHNLVALDRLIWLLHPPHPNEGD